MWQQLSPKGVRIEGEVPMQGNSRNRAESIKKGDEVDKFSSKAKKEFGQLLVEYYFFGGENERLMRTSFKQGQKRKLEKFGTKKN